jgi:plastocyanin
MRWLLAVLAVALVAIGAGAYVSTQGTSGAQMATPEGTPCPSPMAGTPTAMASPTMAASPSASPEACPSGDEFRIDMVDIAFDPTTLTIPANTDVTIELYNTGATAHNFSIDELGISVDVAAGEEGQATINAPAGTYTFYCNVPGHREAGMEGTLTVE